jgi:hypothetical protein
MDTLLQFAGASGTGVFAVVTIALWVASIVLHIAFALAVYARAEGRDTVFVGPMLWALATLPGGPLVALAFWLIHMSSLSTHAKK